MTFPGDGFRSLTDLPGRFRGWDDRVGRFYVPVLSRARRYDRLVGYWRSSTLLVAATALSYFAARRGKMRVIAGAELTDADIEAIRNGRPLDEAVGRRLVETPEEADDIVAAHRWEVLAWMLKEGLLEIRIGVRVDADGELLSPDEADGYFHSKFGVFEDEAGDMIAFSGSDNESASGWRNNHETFHVYRSWGSEETWREHGLPTVRDFEEHWAGSVPGWKVIEFPDESRDHLLRHAPLAVDWVPPPDPAAPPEQPIDLTAAEAELEELRRAPERAGGTGVGFVTLPIEPWPHQRSIASRILGTWPRSYLLADEVGLGKTIEAGLVIRELLLSGKAEKILLLVPASVQRQWQEELWEKFCLDVPSYRGAGFENVAREPVGLEPGVNPWSAFPVVLASSHLARMRTRREQIVDAGPWDLVLVDEAHHARRRGIGGTEAANQLLQLLRMMRDARSWKALILATATPMQMNTAELFDLLDLIGLPELWKRSPEDLEAYYRQLAEKDPKARDWEILREMLASYLAQPDVTPNRYVKDQLFQLSAPARQRIERFHTVPASSSQIASRSPDERRLLDSWLRANTPLKDRIFRTTREALREYKRRGILPPEATIPRRHVEDVFIPLEGDEAELYNRIESYITRYYEAYNADKKTKPLGFIMTVYRRRLTSSLYAVRESLRRRLEGLRAKAALTEFLDEDDRGALENLPDLDADSLEDTVIVLEQEIDELESFVADLNRAIPSDSKVERLVDDIESAFLSGHRSVVVFTQFTDTLHWIREQLKDKYKDQIACYSGDGGSRWNPQTRSWEKLTKQEVKDLFRAGDEVRILLGTDAMSEGLNLQTSDRLINYDMPWNFMRVEQRIGRIDRIGGRPQVYITNYFYSDTVEEQVYKGIREDADWFQQVVGPAQPVLSRVEQVIQSVAMTAAGSARSQALEQELAEVRQAIAEAQGKALKLDDLNDDQPPLETYGADPVIELAEIERVLTSNPLTAPRLHAHPDFEHTYLVEVGGEKIPMTFVPEIYDHNAEIGFMTYGHPVFEKLMEEVL